MVEGMEEGRKRVHGIIAGILVARRAQIEKTADHRIGFPTDPKTDQEKRWQDKRE